MAWIERFTCDVCGKLMGVEEKWWVALSDCVPSGDMRSAQPALRITSWENALAHSAEGKHLCGAGCAHTFLDRWMTELRSGSDGCPGD